MSRNYSDGLLGYGSSSSAFDVDQSRGGGSGGGGSLKDNFQQHQGKISLVVIGVLSIIVIALAAALGNANSQSSECEAGGGGGGIEPGASSSTGTFSSSSSTGSSDAPSLESEVRVEDLFTHMTALQAIATANNGNRAIGEPGFNATVDYIERILTTTTTFSVWKQYFQYSDFNLTATPLLTVVTPNSDSVFNFTFMQDFNVLSYSGSADLRGANVSVVSDGCAAASYAQLAGTVGITQRAGNCTFAQRISFAAHSGLLALIVYNYAAGGGPLISTRAPVDNQLPVMFMTYAAGGLLAEAAASAIEQGAVLEVSMSIQQTRPPITITNICADTPTGAKTSTIIIGSHSDGVKAGAGMNDNGSGTSGNLVWATALSRLLSSGQYPTLPNRIRFCWWGGEELGLLGSYNYVKVAAAQTAEGERLSDIAFNSNFDMMASPNYLYGVLDSYNIPANANISVDAVPGSKILTDRYSSYLAQHGLPMTSKEFNGRSDYGPFLEVGIPAGGISAFIDRLKTKDERDQYDRALGQGKGGIADVATDPCYHKLCDSIQNANPDVFINIAKAHAAVMETLALMESDALMRLMVRPSSLSPPLPQSTAQRPRDYAELWE